MNLWVTLNGNITPYLVCIDSIMTDKKLVNLVWQFPQSYVAR